MRQHVQSAVPFGGECEASLKVVIGEVGEIGKNLAGCHSTAQVFKNVSNGDAGSANAWFTGANSRVDDNAVQVIHGEV